MRHVLALFVAAAAACSSSAPEVAPSAAEDATADVALSTDVASQIDAAQLPELPAAPDVAPDLAPDLPADTGPLCAPGCVTTNPCKTATCDPATGQCLLQDRDGACDDGDPCTSPDQCLAGVCIGPATAGCCTPKCDGKKCGPDGCGKVCGTCDAKQACDPQGQCVAAAPSGDTCAEAVEVAALPFQVTATTAGLANDYEAPPNACIASPLGGGAPDAVFHYAPNSSHRLEVSLSGLGFSGTAYVVTSCADIKNTCKGGLAPFGTPSLGPIWVDVSAGQDVWIIVDGDGVVSGSFTLSLSLCTPQCDGKKCGPSGCGTLCGSCPSFQYECSAQGQCVCLPSCDGKTCGSDGCTGTCAPGCSTSETCDKVGHCVKAGELGDTCATAIPVTTSPFTYEGTTAGLGNDLYAWWACPGNGTSGYLGDEAPDRVFVLNPDVTTTYYVQLTKADFLPALYAKTNCDDPVSCLQASYQAFTLKNQLFFEVPAKTPTYVVVDGHTNGSGTFSLAAKACVAPGDCPAGEQGGTCSYPVDIPFLPYQTSSSGSDDTYALPAGACGMPKGSGKGGPDRAFRYVHNKDGFITITVTGHSGFDPAVYVVTDCTALGTTCLGATDQTGANGQEHLGVKLTKDVPTYIVVDSPSPISGSFIMYVSVP